MFISAGFDAHERDHLHSEKDTQITEFDYQWVTENLVRIANQCCKGRIISVMEGGYNSNAGPVSPLGQSVQYHVNALLTTGKEPYNETLVSEGKSLEELEKLRRSNLKKRRQPANIDMIEGITLRKRRRLNEENYSQQQFLNPDLASNQFEVVENDLESSYLNVQQEQQHLEHIVHQQEVGNNMDENQIEYELDFEEGPSQ